MACFRGSKHNGSNTGRRYARNSKDSTLKARYPICGTSKKSTLKKLREELESGTWLVHNEHDLTAEAFDMSLDPMKLMM